MPRKNEVSDKDQLKEIMTELEVEHRINTVSLVERMETREDKDSTRPVIVEFGSEYDKWQVLSKKKKLMNSTNGYDKVFLELDRSKEERLEAKERYERRKAEARAQREDV